MLLPSPKDKKVYTNSFGGIFRGHNLRQLNVKIEIGKIEDQGTP